MDDTGRNVALVTQTLVANAGDILSDPRSITLPRFWDLCALFEATVLLDRMDTLAGSAQYDTAFSDWLGRQGLYRILHPSVSRDDLRRLLLRLPDDLAGRSSLDADDARTVTASGAVDGLDYTTGLDDLVAQIDRLGGYASARDTAVQDRMYRSNGYLITAAAHGLDYFPDFDRVPFTAGVLQKTYRSLPVQLYEKISESLDEPLNGGAVGEWATTTTIPIPPVSALVLSRSASLADVPEQLLRVRDEFGRYRQYFAEFKEALSAADTIRERRRLLQRYRALLTEVSGPRQEAVSLSEMLNLTEKVVKVAAAPTLPTSYSALLLTQPVEWIRRWWQRRPIAILFRLDSKLPRLSEYRRVVDRLWGEQSAGLLLDQAAEHGSRLRTLMADAERA